MTFNYDIDITKKGEFFKSIRNYDSCQRNHRKNLSSPLVRKFNFKIINSFVARSATKLYYVPNQFSQTERRDFASDTNSDQICAL